MERTKLDSKAAAAVKKNIKFKTTSNSFRIDQRNNSLENKNVGQWILGVIMIVNSISVEAGIVIVEQLTKIKNP